MVTAERNRGFKAFEWVVEAVSEAEGIMVMNARVNKGYAAGFKCALKLFNFALMADVCEERKGRGRKKEKEEDDAAASDFEWTAGM